MASRITAQFTLGTGATAVALTAPEYQVIAEPVGLDDPDRDPVLVQGAGIDGGILEDVVTAPRTIALPILVDRTDREHPEAELRAAWQAVRDAVNPARTGGALARLTVTDEDRPPRWIDGFARLRESGWSPSTRGRGGWQARVLEVTCPDPFFRSAGIPAVWAFEATPPPFFGSPFFPFTLGASQLVGVARDVTLDGDELSHPTWTLTGPLTQVVATWSRPGAPSRSWTLTRTLTAGQVLVVTSDPRRASVRLADGTSVWSSLAPPFDLWPLVPGSQQVTVSVVGGATGTTVVMDHDVLHSAALG